MVYRRKIPDPLWVMGIYVIRNAVSGRVYVGSSLNIRRRIKSHLKLLRKGKHHSPRLQHSWDRHGEGVFVYEKLEEVASADDLVPREQFWIDELRAHSQECGMNSLPRAGSPLGRKLSAEAKARVSARQKGVPKSPEHNAAVSAAKMGVPLSPEHAAKARVANLGRVFSAEVRARMSAGQKGRKQSAEAIEKQRAKVKGKKKSPEHIAKRNATMAALSASGELSRKMKAAYAAKSPEERADIARRRWATIRAKRNTVIAAAVM